MIQIVYFACSLFLMGNIFSADVAHRASENSAFLSFALQTKLRDCSTDDRCKIFEGLSDPAMHNFLNQSSNNKLLVNWLSKQDPEILNKPYSVTSDGKTQKRSSFFISLITSTGASHGLANVFETAVEHKLIDFAQKYDDGSRRYTVLDYIVNGQGKRMDNFDFLINNSGVKELDDEVSFNGSLKTYRTIISEHCNIPVGFKGRCYIFLRKNKVTVFSALFIAIIALNRVFDFGEYLPKVF